MRQHCKDRHRSLAALRNCFGAITLSVCIAVHAQQPPPPPGAGDALRDLGQKAQPVVPPQPPPTINIAPDARRAVKPMPGFRLDVKGYRFSGLTVLPAEELQAVVEKYTGPDRTFEDLQAAASAITEYLRKKGYFVAQAYIPEQKLEGGIVEIAILEGRLGAVRIEMDEGSLVSRDAVASALSHLTPGIVLHTDTVEQALFIASDLRGISVRSVVEPGATPGSADLVVQVLGTRRVDGTIEFDNHGSRFTGENRFGASLNVNSPFGRGDLLSLRGLLGVPGGSADTDFARVSYLTPVGSYGTRLGAAYLKLRYHLGTAAFTPLNQRGDSTVASVFGVHPIVRTRRANLYVQANFDARDFHDDRQAVGTVSDRKIKAGAFSLSGDMTDQFLGGGFNSFSLAYSQGRLDIETAADLAADQGAAGRRANGSYAKLNGSFSRINALWESTSVYFSYAFQLASKNLDGSEKFSLGGPNAVRAYAQGEAAADEAQLITTELRYGIPAVSFIPNGLTASLFHDYGRGRLIDKPLAIEEPTNVRTLQGAGFGLTWGRQDNFILRGTLAWRLSGQPISDPADRKPRLFFQFAKFL
jgi:hemolysin activation/secretion protein